MTLSFSEKGSSLLDAAWAEALEASGSFIRDPALAEACDRVFAGTEAGYQKAIIIQAVGKAADPTLDAQAMQKGIGVDRSWDAREFAKQVFVPWNSKVGCFAHAADPYVSNPYRIPRFDESVRAQRQKPKQFDNALVVLEMLDRTTEEVKAFENLAEVVYALRRFVAERSVEYPLPSRASLKDTLACVEQFVAAKAGGARLQAIVYALFSALASQGFNYSDISSGHVNASDKGAKSAGDVSLRLGISAVAVEVKDRALTAAELEATINKCRVANVTEAVFVVRASSPLASDLGVGAFDDESKRQFSSGLNIYLEEFASFARTVLTLVGEDGRRGFLEAVGKALAEQNADITHKWAWADLVKAV
jgi:hypothetical protein